jgi:ABC-type phosphate transport system substrate-binding protein
MRKLIIAAATAATLATLGLSATAQAQPTSTHARLAATTVSKTVVRGIPAAFQLTKTGTGTTKCTWKVTKGSFPSSVTHLPGTKTTPKNTTCSYLIDGVWPTATKSGKPDTFTITATAGSSTTTFTVKVTVQAAPPASSAVGVGSDTITPVTDQLSSDYNATSPSGPLEYSWDAVNPITGQIGDSIPLKTGCTPIARPDGSSAGITALAGSQVVKGVNCVNYARSSRPRGSSDPPYATGGVAFTALAGDAVTWDTPAANTSAPASLTPAQLNAIYTCTDTNWDQVGGKNQAIVPFLPQSGSGTLSFWLAAIGVTTPGPCVSNDNNTLEENEGVNPVLNNPGTIYLFSVGDWIAQREHSAKCLNTTCTGNSSGVVCDHTPDFNQFFCNESGTMTLREISGVAPLVGKSPNQTINPKFPSTFDRILYNVVPFDPSTSNHIPGAESGAPGGEDLDGIFGASGYDCASSTAKADITAYGFVNLPNCGTTS